MSSPAASPSLVSAVEADRPRRLGDVKASSPLSVHSRAGLTGPDRMSRCQARAVTPCRFGPELAGDVGGNSMTVDYNGNDLLRSQTQGATTQCWTLDGDGQLNWISEDTTSSTWTANLADLASNLGVTPTQSGVATYQYSNISGVMA